MGRAYLLEVELHGCPAGADAEDASVRRRGGREALARVGDGHTATASIAAFEVLGAEIVLDRDPGACSTVISGSRLGDSVS